MIAGFGKVTFDYVLCLSFALSSFLKFAK